MRCGVAWRGVAWRGVAWRGAAWRGAARRGVAWRGVARRGVARRGVARRDMARRGVLWRGVELIREQYLRVLGAEGVVCGVWCIVCGEWQNLRVLGAEGREALQQGLHRRLSVDAVRTYDLPAAPVAIRWLD